MDRVADDMECPFDSRMEQRVMECPVLNSSRFHGTTGGGPLTSGPQKVESTSEVSDGPSSIETAAHSRLVCMLSKALTSVATISPTAMVHYLLLPVRK